jgi:IS5 family transposase
MHHIIGSLLIGAAGGAVAGKRRELRPALRGIIKSGLLAKRKITAIGSSTVAGAQKAQKLAEEGRADLDRAQTEQHS